MDLFKRLIVLICLFPLLSGCKENREYLGVAESVRYVNGGVLSGGIYAVMINGGEVASREMVVKGDRIYRMKNGKRYYIVVDNNQKKGD